MKTTLLAILLMPMALWAANPEEEYDFDQAMAENIETLDYQSVIGTAMWRIEQVAKDMKNRCTEDGECELITFRETIKGWSTHLTLGNGSGSGSSYYSGSQGAINIYNDPNYTDEVVANIGVAYRNIVCERTAIVDEGFEMAYVTLMRGMVTDGQRIKSELEPAEHMLLRAFSTVVGAMKNNGCNSSGRHY